MTETERAIAIIEARLPLYTDIGQINALRECISSIRSAALSAGQAQPGDVSLGERADALARRVWAYFHDGPVSAMWFDNNKDLGGPAHIRDLCRTALSPSAVPEVEKPTACVGEMKTSAGSDYYVCVRVGDRELTPHMHKIRSRAEYDVAEWQWLFNGGEKPDILAYREDAAPSASIEGETP